MTMTTTMMIEASSPLAAMQHQPFMSRCAGFGQDALDYASLARVNFGPNSFNFKDLSMLGRQPPRDYFNMPPPVRGSSPTASLAADLSQNMNIDRSSPQYPTPRRALFANHVFCPRVHITTPPASSSSPGAADCMEMSPLPHKPVRASCEQLQSPTPGPTPLEPTVAHDYPPRPLSPITVAPVDPMQMTLQIPERRRSGNLRPQLLRTKGYSTNSIPQRPNPEAQLPPFRFNTGVPRQRPASSLSLSEIFEGSPPAGERAVCRLASPLVPAKVRPPFMLGHGSKNASPVTHVRKHSVSAVRPKKQFRRSQSMYEHPEDVMQREREACVPVLAPVADMEPPHEPQLPHFYSNNNQTCDLPRISHETLINVLDGKFDHVYDKRVVIDCRFEYEYQGGHIAGAVNYNDKEQLSQQLFELESQVVGSKALLIFHCEFSVHRAPLMAAHIRNKDRSVNIQQYPRLSYPEAYILEGGFNGFYKSHTDRCVGEYVEMNAKEHEAACEVGMAQVKHQQRGKLTRAHTLPLGTHSLAFDSSPTNTIRGRVVAHDDVDMECSDYADFTPLAPRHGQLQYGRSQRMFSY